MSLIPQFWRDITTDPVTGHTIAKDLFKAQAFYAGLLLCFVSAGSDVWGRGREVSIEPALFLLAYALGAQGLKEYGKFQDRRTADANGQPLAVPNPPGDVPAVMTQTPNPNMPLAPPNEAD